jgi:hypothetical protein
MKAVGAFFAFTTGNLPVDPSTAQRLDAFDHFDTVANGVVLYNGDGTRRSVQPGGVWGVRDPSTPIGPWETGVRDGQFVKYLVNGILYGFVLFAE